MPSRRSLCCVVVAGLGVVSALAQSTLVCPEYTKNRDTSATFALGLPAELPAGFVAFCVADSNGVRLTPLQRWEPSVVPGTEYDDARCIDISEDGRWLLYITQMTGALSLVRTDGRGRSWFAAYGAHSCGFYRRSPVGTEVFFSEGSSRIKAVRVHLAADTSWFEADSVRTLVDVSWSSVRLMNDWGQHSWVVGDQVFSRQEGMGGPSGYWGRVCFVTIPDSGRGTAGESDIYAWTNNDPDTIWGCGLAMSHDGRHCLANSARVGSACVPNRKNDPPMDHKGFYVTRFWRIGDPTIALDEQADIYGTSINWCPPVYRKGSFDELEFTRWSFSNDPHCVVGAMRGSSVRALGFWNSLWVVDWMTNAWTKLSPDSTTTAMEDPAMYITDPIGVAYQPAPAVRATARPAARLCVGARTVDVPLGVRSLRVLSLDGRLLWRNERSSTGAGGLLLPEALRQRPLLIVFGRGSSR
jgi:hypothetical protein